jgi:hypothetical protein
MKREAGREEWSKWNGGAEVAHREWVDAAIGEGRRHRLVDSWLFLRLTATWAALKRYGVWGRHAVAPDAWAVSSDAQQHTQSIALCFG